MFVSSQQQVSAAPTLSLSKKQTVWWLHPVVTASLATMPALIIGVCSSELSFLSNWRVPKYLGLDSVAYAVLFLFSFWLGCSVQRGGYPSNGMSLNARQIATLCHAAAALTLLSLSGYVAWAVISMARGLTLSHVLDIATGATNLVGEAKREYMVPVAGVTTLTQFGPVAVVSLLYARTQKRERWMLVAVSILFCLAGVRAILYAERLAVIELAVPAAIFGLSRCCSRNNRPLQWVRWLPLWAPILLLIVFASFEYTRSWRGYYQDKADSDNYLMFAATRLLGYYVTAANNSALLVDETPISPLPYYTAKWVWDFPLVENLVSYEQLSGVSQPLHWQDVLTNHANPEFNNEGGLLVPLADLGAIGGVVFWFIAGLTVGRVFTSFRERNPGGLILYPVIYIGLLELGRLLYWTSGRAVPSLVAGAIVAGVVSKQASASARAARALVRRRYLAAPLSGNL